MHRLLRHSLSLFAVVAVAGASGAGAVALPARTAAAHANYTMYIYKVKVSVKGGTTLSNAYSDIGYVGDVQHEASSSSYSVDGTIASMIFYVGKVPSSFPRNTSSGAPTVVNGTWSDQGTKWLDPSNGTTVPFTCGGTIASTAPPGDMGLEATRAASGFKFNLEVQTVQLTNKPPDSCPNDSRAASLGGIEPDVYVTDFSIPKSQLGRKTIVKQISGPLAKDRSFLSVVCSGNESGCSFNMAWHGVVRLTRTRTMKIKY